MTSPVTGFATGTLIQPLTDWWLQISGTAQGVEISQALEYAVEQGAISAGVAGMYRVPGQNPVWRIQKTDLNGVDTFATQGDYIVITATSDGAITDLKLYNGPDGPYSNPVFANLYTVNTPIVWAATTTAPVATATPGNQATIVFPQPTSANRPFTYTVKDGAANPITLSGSPVVDSSGNVTLTATGLTTGDSYTFTVTVDTQYSGVSATSIASNSITAAALPWAATSTAPVATAQTSGAATLTFPAPAGTGATYTVSQNTGGAKSAATIGAPTVSGNTVTLAVSGLTSGSDYTFTITATEGANSATSIASNSVTAQ